MQSTILIYSLCMQSLCMHPPMHIAYAGIYALHLHAGIYAVHLHACIPMYKLYEYSAIFVVYVFIQIM